MAHPAQSAFVYRTPDVDDFKTVVAGCLAPFRLRTETGGAYRPELRHAALGEVSLSSIRYGDPIEIETQLEGAFYLLQIPLKGEFGVIDAGGRQTRFGRGAAHLVRPEDYLRMRWGPNCRQLVIRFEQSAADEFAIAGAAGGAAGDGGPARIDLQTPRGGALNRYIHFLLGEIENDVGFVADRTVSRSHQQALVAMIAAAAADSNDPVRPARDRSWAAPYYVKRAERFIEQRLDQPIDIAEIVCASGVSQRTLYRGFQAVHRSTPAAFLKARRLARAHFDLCAATPGSASVTDIAHKWGFSHLGKFAADYRRVYDRSPSADLRDAPNDGPAGAEPN